MKDKNKNNGITCLACGSSGMISESECVAQDIAMNKWDAFMKDFGDI